MVRSSSFSDIKKILVIKLRHIGDVLLTVPALRALKKTFPGSSISVLINAGTEGVLEGNPLINELIVFDRSIKKMPAAKKLFQEAAFLKRLRSKSFDMSVDLTGGDRAAVASWLSGARYRIGWKTPQGFVGKKLLLTHPAEPDGSSHTVLQNLDIVRPFGINTDNLSVDFFTPETEKVFIKQVLSGKNVKEDDTVVHIHPTSRWLFKCWRDEYVAEIIKWLMEQGIKVILTSAPDKKESDKISRILSFLSPHHASGSNLIDLSGKTSIKQLGAISEMSDLFFGVDTAPMHIAAAVGIPVVALFGPSGAFHWGPWDNAPGGDVPYKKRNGVQSFGMHTVIQKSDNCIPCGKDGCDGTKKSRCLEDIGPEEVKKVLSSKIGEIKK
jgi:heptosyltransferase-3